MSDSTKFSFNSSSLTDEYKKYVLEQSLISKYKINESKNEKQSDVSIDKPQTTQLPLDQNSSEIELMNYIHQKVPINDLITSYIQNNLYLKSEKVAVFGDLSKANNKEELLHFVRSNSACQTVKFFLDFCKHPDLKINHKYLLHCLFPFIENKTAENEEIYELIDFCFNNSKYFVIATIPARWISRLSLEQTYFFIDKLQELVDNKLCGINGECIRRCCALFLHSEGISPNYDNGLPVKMAIRLGFNSCLRQLLSHPMSKFFPRNETCTDKNYSCDFRYIQLLWAYMYDNIEAGEIMMKKILAENSGITIDQMLPIITSPITNDIYWEQFLNNFRRFLVKCQSI